MRPSYQSWLPAQAIIVGGSSPAADSGKASVIGPRKRSLNCVGVAAG